MLVLGFAPVLVVVVLIAGVPVVVPVVGFGSVLILGFGPGFVLAPVLVLALAIAFGGAALSVVATDEPVGPDVLCPDDLVMVEVVAAAIAAASATAAAAAAAAAVRLAGVLVGGAVIASDGRLMHETGR